MAEQQATEGWTLVTRRRRPPHFLPGPHSPPRRTTPFNLNQPSYAQVVRAGPSPPPPPTNTQLTNPDKTHSYVRRPQSPTNLRYPPNPHFKEWWGRCFHYAQKGHIVAECKLPRAQPHVDTQVNLADNRDPSWTGSGTLTGPTAPKSQALKPTKGRAEPTFEEFLGQPEPQEEPYMPSIRPTKVLCYFNRDEQYLHSSQKLSSAIIIQPPEHLKGKFTLDQATDLVAASGKLATNQLQVGRLSSDRFLAVLPPEINREEVVTNIPKRVWDDGFTLSPYSPSIDAAISIPFFKIWVHIKGVPLELYTETHMARVISSFGIYLGSMEPQVLGDCQTWSVFLATDDLALIPYSIEIRVGGLVHTAQIHPRKWTKGQVFKRSELPPTSTPYRPPIDTSAPMQTEAPATSRISIDWFQDDDVVPMSLTALREIFRHIPSEELPADFAACLEGDKQAIEANHAAYRR